MPKVELTPAEANRLFYADYAERYDELEFCAHDPRARGRLAAALDLAISNLPTDAQVLDAGGGSGNASEILVGRGFDPLLVDVSIDMARQWERKALALGATPRHEISPLEDFFAADERRWDLIVFSSVMHHLADPAAVLRAAVEHLNPGGYVITVFDPLRLKRGGMLLRRADYLAWIVFHSPKRILEIVRRRLNALRSGGSGDPGDEGQAVGAIAEYHALAGLDDDALLAQAAAGATVVAHERYFDARYAFTRVGARAIGSPTSFSLVIRAATAPAAS